MENVRPDHPPPAYNAVAGNTGPKVDEDCSMCVTACKVAAAALLVLVTLPIMIECVVAESILGLVVVLGIDALGLWLIFSESAYASDVRDTLHTLNVVLTLIDILFSDNDRRSTYGSSNMSFGTSFGTSRATHAPWFPGNPTSSSGWGSTRSVPFFPGNPHK